MGDVTALNMDAITDKSGHQIVPNAVSACITPMAPSPMPVPYPVICMVNDGITDPPMRTKIKGCFIGTTGAVLKVCHGNEAGTLKEIVSLNTAGPVFIIVGAPNILCELGMMGFTGSLCVSNKAITVGAGATTSGAGGDTGGAGAGSGGNGDGDTSDSSDPSNGGGGGGGDTNSGASASPADAPNRYCPDKNAKAPPPYVDHIEDMDLRNHESAVNKHGSEVGKKAAHAATKKKPGGSTKTKQQAFWSGGGMKAAVDDGLTIQEQTGGAKQLDQMGKDGETFAGRENWKKEYGDDSKITNERLWKTISRRSAENASGTVSAYVAGSAPPNNVFASVELPTLLHNDDCKVIHFYDPDHRPPPKPKPVSTWKRNKKDGCWEGPPVPPGKDPPADSPYPRIPGFSLHPKDGFVRPP